MFLRLLFLALACLQNCLREKENTTTYFAVVSDDHGRKLDACQRAYSGNKKYVLIGSSVTRHYAFSLHDILNKQLDADSQQVDRQEEKKLCAEGVLGSTACSFTGTVDIHFVPWRSGLLSGPAWITNNSADDIPRQANATHSLLSGFVTKYNMQCNDVLIFDGSLFECCNDAKKPIIVESAKLWPFASYVDLKIDRIFTILDALPVRSVLLTSSPLTNHTVGQIYNAYTPTINALLYRAMSSRQLLTNNNKTMNTLLIDTWQYLVTKRALFADHVHHPGEPSSVTMRSVLRILASLFCLPLS